MSPSQVKTYVALVEEEGIARVKMLSIITGSYFIFWGPLFIVTVWNWSWSWVQAKNSIAHEVALHISFCHSMVTPLLYLVLHPGLRRAAQEIFCCSDTQLLIQAGKQCEVGNHRRGSVDKR